jgi:crotonobetainyl-CoA:carnitine CoA-transferase CaiB-like acyl-CoA transferase
MNTHSLDSVRPLAGFKVVSLAINLPGPVAIARLRDLGASITKIEPPEGDPLAVACPAWYADLQRDVVVERMDLKQATDRGRLLERLDEFDLLLTSSRQGALARLGLSWDELHERSPRLCQVAIVGHAPPDDERAGHDLTYQAALGLVDPPRLPRCLLADLGGALEAAFAAVSLLLARQRGEPAAMATVSLADAAKRLGQAWDYGLTRPRGVLGGGLPGYNMYEARDGWVAVAALEPRFAQRLRGELGVETLAVEALAAFFRGRPAVEWERWAADRDLPIVAVRRSET